MSRRPPILETVALPESRGIHTFSNGTEWECWAEHNCFSCRWWDPDEAGTLCAFEGAALLSRVSPELASQFGWTQPETKYGPLSGWDAPRECPFFKDRDDDSPDPPVIDPTQFTFLVPDGWPDDEDDDLPPIVQICRYGHVVEYGEDGCQECVEIKSDAWYDQQFEHQRGN